MKILDNIHREVIPQTHASHPHNEAILNWFTARNVLQRAIYAFLLSAENLLYQK